MQSADQSLFSFSVFHLDGLFPIAVLFVISFPPVRFFIVLDVES